MNRLDPAAGRAKNGTARDRSTRNGSRSEGRSPFPPISDYAFLSDGEVTALIAPDGNVEWMSVPRMDSPSIFGAMLDRDSGVFRLGPADMRVPAARRYLPGTMINETSWSTPTGWVIVRDVLLMGPWHHDRDRSRTHRRPPTDYDAEHVLLRTVRCVTGEVQLALDCEPVLDYGRLHGSWEYVGQGYREGVYSAEGSDVRLTLASDLNLGFEGPRAIGDTLIKEGEVRFCALSWGPEPPPTDAEDAKRRLVWTAHHWQYWLARAHLPDHRWRPYLERSALTLEGLTYAPTGAVVAAATTSQHFTSSKVMCWVAADRGARLARLRDDEELAARWQAGADEIHEDVCANGVDERGVFTQAYGSTAHDASALLIPLVGFLPGTDGRVRKTVQAVSRELAVDGLVRRYKVGETDDGLSGDEGAFVICSFWLVSALVETGETARARRLCENLLAHASPLHLYGEEIDPETGRHLGNFPQAFTHLALINAVMRVIDTEG